MRSLVISSTSCCGVRDGNAAWLTWDDGAGVAVGVDAGAGAASGTDGADADAGACVCVASGTGTGAALGAGTADGAFNAETGVDAFDTETDDVPAETSASERGADAFSGAGVAFKMLWSVSSF